MFTKKSGYDFQKFQKDFLASIVVFLVALPLCLGIAVASGASPQSGLISGAIGGILVGFFGGSPLQVSGPANGLIVVVADLIRDHGVQTLGLSVFLAGLFQFTAGALKFGQFFRAIAPAVIHGLMAGFAIVIFSSQLFVMLGAETQGSTLKNIAYIPILIRTEIEQAIQGTLPAACIVGLMTITLIILWKKFAPKKLKMIPAALVAVIFTTGFAKYFNLNVAAVNIPSDFGFNLEHTIGSISLQGFDLHLFELAVTIAIIASIETLLSAAATDQQHNGPRTNYDKELAAQGFGNMICGLLGAIPITGVIIRSTANVQAGATTKVSTILHGAWILLAAFVFAPALNLIPIACLAAILIHAVFSLVNIKALSEMQKQDSSSIYIFATTAAVIVSVNVLAGVFTGFILSLVKLLHTFVRLRIDLERDPNQNKIRIKLKGVASFLQIPQLARTLENLNPKAEVLIETQNLLFIDQACKDLLRYFQKSHEGTGGTLRLQWEDLPDKFRPVGVSVDDARPIKDVL